MTMSIHTHCHTHEKRTHSLRTALNLTDWCVSMSQWSVIEQLSDPLLFPVDSWQHHMLTYYHDLNLNSSVTNGHLIEVVKSVG